MNNEAAVHRDLGYLDGKIESLEARIKSIDSKLDQVVSAVNQHSGGIKVLAGVATVGGAVGAALVKVIATIKGA